MSEKSSDYDSDSSETTVLSSSSGEQDFSNFIDLNGKVIGNYHLMYLLGKGSYAQVWLAFNNIKKDFYALKIQHPDDFDSARQEVKILKKIEKLPYKINVIENFMFHFSDNKKSKYYVIVFPVYGSNLEDFGKNKLFDNGFDENLIKKFTKQTLKNLNVLHEKYNLIHCDIKPENFLLSNPDYHIKKIIESYPIDVFEKSYQKILNDNKDIKDNIKKNMNLREKLHSKILKLIDFEKIKKLEIPEEYLLEQLNTSNFLLSDFGSFCHIDEKYDEDFGTRYYRAPENILVSDELSYSVDIWSLGCSIYELLTNHILFDPIKTSKFSCDHYHLSEIFQLGRFSNKEIKTFSRRKEFYKKDRSLKELPRVEDIKEKFKLIKNDFWKEFVLKTLTVSYKKRPKANELYQSFSEQ